MENTRKLVKKEYYLLGVKVITAKEGKNAGKKFGIIDLQTELYFDDNTTAYNVESSFVSEEKAIEIAKKNIPHRVEVTLKFEDVVDLNSRPRILDIVQKQ